MPALGAVAEGKWMYPILQTMMMKVMVKVVMIVMMMMLSIVMPTNLVEVMIIMMLPGAVLRSSVRELLCSEAMAALGVSRDPCSSGWFAKILFNHNS